MEYTQRKNSSCYYRCGTNIQKTIADIFRINKRISCLGRTVKLLVEKSRATSSSSSNGIPAL